GWELGTCLWSPTKGSNGQDRYSLMREPEPGHLVLHLVKGAPGSRTRRELVGWSHVAGPPRVTAEQPLLPSSWGDRSEYFRVDLERFFRLPEPINIDELIARRTAELRAEIDEDHPPNHPFTRYGDGV